MGSRRMVQGRKIMLNLTKNYLASHAVTRWINLLLLFFPPPIPILHPSIALAPFVDLNVLPPRSLFHSQKLE